MENSVTLSPFTIVLLAVGSIFILWFISVSNRLAKYLVVIKESKKNIDIALAKRYDTITEMLKVAKSYAKHERRVFVELVELRKGATLDEMNGAAKQQDEALRQIFAVGENYPQMLSSQQFLNLQNQIESENDQLAAAKRIVNSNISTFNQVIVAFPASIVAGLKGLHTLPFLEETNIQSKQSINDLNYDIDDEA